MNSTDLLIPVRTIQDILPAYRHTPIAKLLEYHNLDLPYESYDSAQMLVCMCIDNRKHLHMPDNFSFIIRSGGANLRDKEFKVSFAIAIGQVRHIAIIGHNQCGMVNLTSRKSEFINGLIQIAGWDQQRAEAHFETYAGKYEISSETDFVLSETKRMRLQYPSITIAPMIYLVDDNKLYFINEDLKD